MLGLLSVQRRQHEEPSATLSTHGKPHTKHEALWHSDAMERAGVGQRFVNRALGACCAPLQCCTASG